MPQTTDASFNQISIWLTATTRPDLTMLMRKSAPTLAEQQTLLDAGIDLGNPDTVAMIAGLKPALSTLDQLSVFFHQTIGDLIGKYPGPDCPKSAQLKIIATTPDI
jgi:hypothetical protein